MTNNGSINVYGGLTLEGGTSITDGSGGSITLEESGAALTLNDATITGGALTNGGTIYADGGGPNTLDVSTFTNDGTVIDYWNLAVSSNVTGTGSLEIGTGATLSLGGTSTNTVTFEGGTGLLDLTNASGFSDTIDNFTGTLPNSANSDEIKLTGVWTQESQTPSDGNLVLVLQNGGETATLTFADFNGSLTINNDGTEVTAFACQHDAPAVIARPGQLPDGRVVFLASALGSAVTEGSAECVRMARPFLSRAKAFPALGARVCSVCSEGENGFLVCAGDSRSSRAVYRLEGSAGELGASLFEDSAWDCVEVAVARARQRPMGRLSTVDAAKGTGQILCLNANDTTYNGGKETGAAAARIRVLTGVAPGRCRALGEVRVQDDGSFMAEVPADIPLGFEALDTQGQVLRRVEPILWVRPGENRSCTGCHAAHNRAPHNHRPLAVYAPVPCLGREPEASLAQKDAVK